MPLEEIEFIGHIITSVVEVSCWLSVASFDSDLTCLSLDFVFGACLVAIERAFASFSACTVPFQINFCFEANGQGREKTHSILDVHCEATAWQKARKRLPSVAAYKLN